MARAPDDVSVALRDMVNDRLSKHLMSVHDSEDEAKRAYQNLCKQTTEAIQTIYGMRT